MKRWYRSKTIWTGIVAVVGAVGAYLSGEVSMADALQAVTTALIGIFIRTGMMGTDGRS